MATESRMGLDAEPRTHPAQKNYSFPILKKRYILPLSGR
jgi:hypothetical protein